MGTRNLTCVVKNGEYKVAQYCQWDGYPSGQGITILDWLTKVFDKTKFEKTLQNVDWATDEMIEATWDNVDSNRKNSGLVSLKVAEDHGVLYPEFCRETGPKILDIIQNLLPESRIKLENSLTFAADSLFCEWCYVIDLDKNTFEVFKGFNKSPIDNSERFSFLPVSGEPSYPGGDTYYQVTHNHTFYLDNLPTKELFLSILEPKEEEW